MRAAATLPNVESEADVEAAVRLWYELGYTDLGDVPFDWERNVVLVNVRDPESVRAVQEDWHPIRHALIIRYEYEPRYQEVRILNRAEIYGATHPYPRAAQLAAVPEEAFFNLSAHMGDTLDAMHWVSLHGQTLGLGELLQTALPQKIAHYLSGCALTPLPPSNALDCGASILAALVGERLEALHPPCANVYSALEVWAHYHAKRYRTQYELARYRVECEQLLVARMAPFCTERSLLQLLQWNGLEAWIKQHYVGGSAADYRAFRALYPDATYAPSVFFRVPCSEGGMYPVRLGGIVHLPCYGPALTTWMQQRWLMQRDQAYARQRELVRAPMPPEVSAAIEEQAQRLYRHYYDAEHAPRPPNVLKRRRLQSTTSTGAPFEGPHQAVPDIEDLWSLLPPCVTAVRSWPQFPRFAARAKMALIMWHGGIDTESIWSLMETLPEPPLFDPNAQPRPLQDPVRMEERHAHIHGLLNAKDVGKWKPICWHIIADTVNGKPDKLHCPFVAPIKEKSPGLGLEEMRIACNMECNHGRPFGASPAHLVEKALYRRKYLAELHAKEKGGCSRWNEGIDDTLDKPLKARDEEEEEDSSDE